MQERHMPFGTPALARRKPAAAAAAAICASTVLLAACGGGGDGGASAARSADVASADEQGRASLQALARLTTTTAPIIANSLGACTEAVSSTWDIKLANCSSTNRQQFRFVPVASGTDVYLIKNVSTGLCIAATGSMAGAFVELGECDGTAEQQFGLETLPTGSMVMIKGMRSGLCLTAPRALNTAAFSMGSCSAGNTRQSYKLPVVTVPTPTPDPTPTPTPGSWWKPAATTSWHWQLSGDLKTNVAATIYDIDLFNVSTATMQQLKSAGHKVVCYFSAGSSEDWRDDYRKFSSADKGLAMDEWPGEHWIDIRSANVRSIMAARLDLAKSKGCDGVEPDNVDGYTNRTGFPLSAQHQIDYNRFLADEAHRRGLAIGLKNDVDQLAALEPHFDFAVNEQCHQYNECAGYASFTSRNKPVLNAEYAAKYRNNTGGARDTLCAAARRLNMRTLVLPLALDGSYRFSCDH
ncbi:endo alpha-1,4 polygalactosaminidase [Schlegelella sp. S2-27]|uniref:Endo alpha-1,4 polygalactosaminidase n=1 Tax=Caldimonas mangrovi TaxID=2944811 RepID=A0ABT0YRS1_9BURK|nr:endo alpha-1,4 polygalactosaminidase [Caldimonas mangrovi]MCM5681435.1 endo alpha-1,4 polygalactosaminidase [Caldimonas mangrovi]